MRKHVVRLHSRVDQLAAIPAALGFVPENSLVLVCFTNGTLTCAVRCDLPGEGNDAAALAAYIADRRPIAAADDILAVTIGREHPALLDELAHRLGDTVDTFHLDACVAGARWKHHQRGGKVKEEGILPDPASTALATAAAVEGRITHRTRDDLHTQFAPDDAAALARRDTLIEAAIAEFPATTDAIVTIRDALRAAHAGTLSVTDELVVGCVLALADVAVRDAAMTIAVPPETPLARAAADLWAALTRATPAPDRAEPAALAAFTAFIAGDGTTTNIAADIAVRANPDFILARLVQRAAHAGVHPREFHGIADGDDLGLRHALADLPADR